MENKDSKIIWIVLGVIVVIVVLVVLFTKKDEVFAPVEEEVVVTEVAETQNGNTTGVTVDQEAITAAYKQALVTYKDRRIQLNTQNNECQAVPNRVTFKNGTKIMIDNRAPAARSVKLGSTFTIPGYGYQIVTLSSATLPATWLMDCDGQQNVATVLIQK